MPVRVDSAHPIIDGSASPLRAGSVSALQLYRSETDGRGSRRGRAGGGAGGSALPSSIPTKLTPGGRRLRRLRWLVRSALAVAHAVALARCCARSDVRMQWRARMLLALAAARMPRGLRCRRLLIVAV